MKLYPTDRRLGQKGEQGQILQWPATDIIGRPYSKPATTRSVTEFLFIVVPPQGFNEVVEVVQPEAPKPTKKGKSDHE